MVNRQNSERNDPLEQLPLEFNHAPRTSRDDLVVSDPLSPALAIIDRWPDWPSCLVVLTGPGGVGKTHLAHVWKKRSGATEISAASEANEALSRAASGPILIEDVDRSGFDDNLLFHLINAVRQHDTSLLMTARSWPAAWPVRLPDLRSRLRAATISQIGEPDDIMLAMVIEKLFSDRQIVIDPKVVSYVVRRMERTMSAGQTIVDRIDRLALARNCKINRALAAEVLEDLDKNGYDTGLT
ncbi:MAG: DnaA regulatory inactivator HdaA [Pseudomonadota bacterium]